MELQRLKFIIFERKEAPIDVSFLYHCLIITWLNQNCQKQPTNQLSPIVHITKTKKLFMVSFFLSFFLFFFSFFLFFLFWINIFSIYLLLHSLTHTHKTSIHWRESKGRCRNTQKHFENLFRSIIDSLFFLMS